MPNFKFVCEHRDFHTYDVDSKTIVETNKESLYDVIEEFERFLKGAGFVFEGQLDIVNDNTNQETEINFSSLSSEDLVFDYEGAAFTDDFIISDDQSSVNLNLDNMSSTVSIDSPQSTAWPFPINERPQ